MTYYVCPSVPHLAYLGYGTARLVDPEILNHFMLSNQTGSPVGFAMTHFI